MKRKEVENRMILLALTGSHSYGLAMPSSDKDYKGIFIAGEDYYHGIHKIEQKDSGWNEPGNGEFPQLDNNRDTVVYELSKYLMLASKCNPNILEILWTEPQFIEYLNPLGRRLMESKELFVSNRLVWP